MATPAAYFVCPRSVCGRGAVGNTGLVARLVPCSPVGAVWLGGRQWRELPAGAVARRLARDSGLIHRPLGTLQDQLANNHNGRATAL